MRYPLRPQYIISTYLKLTLSLILVLNGNEFQITVNGGFIITGITIIFTMDYLLNFVHISPWVNITKDSKTTYKIS